MNIIIGISHPKHVYIFKNTINELKAKGHNVLVLVSDKEMTCDLLNKHDIDYVLMGRNQKTLILKFLQVIKFFFVTFYFAIKNRTSVFVGFGYIHFALVSLILRKPFIFLEDTEVAIKLHRLLLPFTSSFLTTSGFKNRLSKRQIWMNGNLELLYLHPKRFRTELFEKPKEKYVLLRFVSWSAFHDVGHRGLSLQAKKHLVYEISRYAKVYIASEGKLPDEFAGYQLNISTEKIHEFVYGAELIVGESPTMTTESAILGTPAICISSWACDSLGNFAELYKDDLIYCYHPLQEDEAIQKAVELLSRANLKEVWQEKAKLFTGSRIDVTAFLVWFIENYPSSHELMLVNPEYQNRFM